jgi:hypothetical protein
MRLRLDIRLKRGIIYVVRSWLFIIIACICFSFPLSGQRAKKLKFIGYIDKNRDGINDLFKDANGDGINDITGRPYPRLFGYIDKNRDGINDLFKDANGDGINDYDNSFIDKNGNRISDNVIDANGDGINDITGRVVRKFRVGKKKSVKSRKIGIKKFPSYEVDIFVDKERDGFNDLLNEKIRKKFFSLFSRSTSKYFAKKPKFTKKKRDIRVKKK